MCVMKKLQKIRTDLQSKPMKKSGNNKFAGYQYFELGDFLPTVVQMFNDAGLFSRVSFTADTATLTITDTEDKSEVVFTSPMADAQLKGCHPIQNLGAVETYERRYLYVAALDIVEHDALDASEPVKEQPAKKPASVAGEVLARMDPNEQAFLRGLHEEVMGATNVFEAYEKVKATLDADEQIAFWALFDSKQRSAIKVAAKAKEAEKIAA